MQATNLETLSKAELIAIINSLEIDPAFKCYTRSAAERRVSTVTAEQSMIFLDIANMHAANHVYTMDGVDTRIQNVVSSVRGTDIIYKHGGDEIVVIVPTSSLMQVLNRIENTMRANDLYGVYGVLVSTEDMSLSDCVKRCDAAVSAVKLDLETRGLKPGRDEVYKRLDSIVTRA